MEDLKNKKQPGAGELAVIDKQKKSALDKLAARLDLSPAMLTETLKATAFSLCKENAQFVSAVVVANTYGLNPILREMTAFPGKSGGVVPVVMIDGWIKLVNRQESYNGVELTENKSVDAKGKPLNNKSGTNVESVTAKFYLKDREHPVVVTEYMEECYDVTKEPWKRWPRRMLRHKAYIQGARIAFGFSGIYDEDEKDRIIEAEAVAAVTDPVIGLKHDKAGQDQAGLGKEAAAGTGGAAEGPAAADAIPEWNQVGDLARFGAKDANTAKFVAQNIEKCAAKLGKETFMRIVGGQGFDSLQAILKVADLTKIVNLALDEIKKLESA